MTINDKIKQIIVEKNLTPSYFADEIGVQRPSISHILSGRNRPSFDIIQKIIRRFPDLGYDWIMEDEPQSGPQTDYRNRTANRLNTTDQQAFSTSMANPGGIRDGRGESGTSANRRSATDTVESDESAQPQRIDRIVVFYSDGTFREYFSQ